MGLNNEKNDDQDNQEDSTEIDFFYNQGFNEILTPGYMRIRTPDYIRKHYNLDRCASTLFLNNSIIFVKKSSPVCLAILCFYNRNIFPTNTRWLICGILFVCAKKQSIVSNSVQSKMLFNMLSVLFLSGLLPGLGIQLVNLLHKKIFGSTLFYVDIFQNIEFGDPYEKDRLVTFSEWVFTCFFIIFQSVLVYNSMSFWCSSFEIFSPFLSTNFLKSSIFVEKFSYRVGQSLLVFAFYSLMSSWTQQLIMKEIPKLESGSTELIRQIELQKYITEFTAVGSHFLMFTYYYSVVANPFLISMNDYLKNIEKHENLEVLKTKLEINEKQKNQQKRLPEKIDFFIFSTVYPILSFVSAVLSLASPNVLVAYQVINTIEPFGRRTSGELSAQSGAGSSEIDLAHFSRGAAELSPRTNPTFSNQPSQENPPTSAFPDIILQPGEFNHEMQFVISGTPMQVENLLESYGNQLGTQLNGLARRADELEIIPKIPLKMAVLHLIQQGITAAPTASTFLGTGDVVSYSVALLGLNLLSNRTDRPEVSPGVAALSGVASSSRTGGQISRPIIDTRQEIKTDKIENQPTERKTEKKPPLTVQVVAVGQDQRKNVLLSPIKTGFYRDFEKTCFSVFNLKNDLSPTELETKLNAIEKDLETRVTQKITISYILKYKPDVVFSLPMQREIRDHVNSFMTRFKICRLAKENMVKGLTVNGLTTNKILDNFEKISMTGGRAHANYIEKVIRAGKVKKEAHRKELITNSAIKNKPAYYQGLQEGNDHYMFLFGDQYCSIKVMHLFIKLRAYKIGTYLYNKLVQKNPDFCADLNNYPIPSNTLYFQTSLDQFEQEHPEKEKIQEWFKSFVVEPSQQNAAGRLETILLNTYSPQLVYFSHFNTVLDAIESGNDLDDQEAFAAISEIFYFTNDFENLETSCEAAQVFQNMKTKVSSFYSFPGFLVQNRFDTFVPLAARTPQQVHKDGAGGADNKTRQALEDERLLKNDPAKQARILSLREQNESDEDFIQLVKDEYNENPLSLIDIFTGLDEKNEVKTFEKIAKLLKPRNSGSSHPLNAPPLPADAHFPITDSEILSTLGELKLFKIIELGAYYGQLIKNISDFDENQEPDQKLDQETKDMFSLAFKGLIFYTWLGRVYAKYNLELKFDSKMDPKIKNQKLKNMGEELNQYVKEILGEDCLLFGKKCVFNLNDWMSRSGPKQNLLSGIMQTTNKYFTKVTLHAFNFGNTKPQYLTIGEKLGLIVFCNGINVVAEMRQRNIPIPESFISTISDYTYAFSHYETAVDRLTPIGLSTIRTDDALEFAASQRFQTNTTWYAFPIQSQTEPRTLGSENVE